MSFAGEFRTVLFGGYNKNDVQGYIQELQKNAEMSSLEYEKEIVGLKSKIKKMEDERTSWKESVQQQYDEEIDDFCEKEKKLETPLYSEQDNGEIIDQLNIQLKENKRLREEIVDLESKVLAIMKEKKVLEEELLQLQESDIPQNDINNIEIIAKVLEDARLNAKYIEEKAHQNAEEIVKQARMEGQKFLDDKKALIDKELESKGIRLIAAKYKIDAFRSEISNTQQKLFDVCTDMEKMVESLPQRLDQLWDDDRYFSICDREEQDE